MKSSSIILCFTLFASITFTACHKKQADETPIQPEATKIFSEPTVDPWADIKSKAFEVVGTYKAKKDIKKYEVYGKIIDGAEGVLAVFGSSFPVGGYLKKGYDPCTHMSANIQIMLPKDEGVMGNLYYHGQHCCYPELVTQGTNAFGANVPIYWFGACAEESDYKTALDALSQAIISHNDKYDSIGKKNYPKTQYSELAEQYFTAIRNKDAKTANALCCSDTASKMQKITKALISYVVPPEIIDMDNTMAIVYSLEKPSESYKVKVYDINYGLMSREQACISLIQNTGEVE